VLDLAAPVLYDPPPEGGLDPPACERHECFLIDRSLLFGERRIEIPMPGGAWFVEELPTARMLGRAWLARAARGRVAGARALISHGDVLVDPRTGRPTCQLAGPARLIDLLESGGTLAP
jgi:hypothetical protein